MDLVRHDLEPGTSAVYLTVPRNNVVLLQAYFELYEGIGTVRTLDHPDQIVCVLTTDDQYHDCIKLLEAVRSEIGWTQANYTPSS